MRIGLLIGCGFTGADHAAPLWDLAQELATAGHDIAVVCHEPCAPQLAQFSGTVSVTGFSKLAKKTLGLGSLALHVLDVERMSMDGSISGLGVQLDIGDMPSATQDAYVRQVFRRLVSIHRTAPLDLVLCCQLGLLTVVAHNLSVHAHVPYKVLVDDLRAMEPTCTNADLANIVARALNHVSGVVVPNRFLRNKVIEHFPQLTSLIEVVPSGVSDALFHSGGERIGEIVYAGSLSMRFGVQHLLAAMPLITSRVGPVELSIVGEGPDARALHGAWSALSNGQVDGFLLACRAAPSALDAPNACHAWMEPLADLAELYANVGDISAALRGTRVHWSEHASRADMTRRLRRCQVSVQPNDVAGAQTYALAEALACGAYGVAVDHESNRPLFAALEANVPELAGRLRVRADRKHFVEHLATRVAELWLNPPRGGARAAAEAFVRNTYRWAIQMNGLTRLVHTHIPLIREGTRVDTHDDTRAQLRASQQSIHPF